VEVGPGAKIEFLFAEKMAEEQYDLEKIRAARLADANLDNIQEGLESLPAPVEVRARPYDVFNYAVTHSTWDTYEPVADADFKKLAAEHARVLREFNRLQISYEESQSDLQELRAAVRRLMAYLPRDKPTRSSDEWSGFGRVSDDDFDAL
jgi:hypothetical protein